MQYLTYDEYLDLGGSSTVTADAFPQLEFKARKRIDYLTDCRVQAMQEIPEEVKRTMVEFIRHESNFGAQAQTDNPLIASFNTDGYSESYGSVTEQTAVAEKTLLRTARDLLYGVLDDKGAPLLYRGVCS